MLYRSYELIKKNDPEGDVIFTELRSRYTSIISELKLSYSIDTELNKIRDALSHRPGRDYAASRGEYLNGLILAYYLGFDFIDAADVIFFKDDGTFDSERTNSTLSEVLKQHKNAVIPGFYGSMPNGTIKTFSRGGSDITGSIVARAANADLYENWTDVSGFLMADPRIIADPKPIDTITYRELRELSYMGATVLHEDAIFPVRFAGIPINIRNTNRPEDAGTMIVSHTKQYDKESVITGIAGKKGFSVINIEKDMMNSEVGFGRRVLEVLEKFGISFEHLPSGIDTMSVIVATSELEGKRDKILNAIYREVNPDKLIIDDEIALLAVVGRGMIKTKGTAARVFTAMANASVNIRMIDQGSSEISIILGVDETDFEKALGAIYDEFVSVK